MLTRHTAMIAYVIELSSHSDLLGKSEEHKIIIDGFRTKNGLLETILAFICHQRHIEDTEVKQSPEDNRPYLK
jgi:hypothetical protein